MSKTNFVRRKYETKLSGVEVHMSLEDAQALVNFFSDSTNFSRAIDDVYRLKKLAAAVGLAIGV